MSKSHYEVIEGFKIGKMYRGCNVWANEQAVYSYGTHFPLAIRRITNGKAWFLLNGDKYSPSTSKHQSYTYSIFRDSPRVAFSAIRAAGINPFKVDLVDFVKDGGQSVSLITDREKFDNFTVPIGAEYRESRDGSGRVYEKSWHRIGSVVLKYEDKYYLCSMDEGSYFVSWLPGPVASVKEAFAMLQPEPVRVARAKGIEVLRQGEWFFISVGRLVKGRLIPPEKHCPKNIPLMYRNSHSNRHVVTRMCTTVEGIMVRGCVRHKTPDGRRGQHRMLKLGDGKTWYIAYRNTSLGDWSANGNVDSGGGVWVDPNKYRWVGGNPTQTGNTPRWQHWQGVEYGKGRVEHE